MRTSKSVEEGISQAANMKKILETSCRKMLNWYIKTDITKFKNSLQLSVDKPGISNQILIYLVEQIVVQCVILISLRAF